MGGTVIDHTLWSLCFHLSEQHVAMSGKNSTFYFDWRQYTHLYACLMWLSVGLHNLWNGQQRAHQDSDGGLAALPNWSLNWYTSETSLLFICLCSGEPLSGCYTSVVHIKEPIPVVSESSQWLNIHRQRKTYKSLSSQSNKWRAKAMFNQCYVKLLAGICVIPDNQGIHNY